MPAKSKAQQKFMGMVHGVQKGTIKPSTVSAKVKKAAKGMKKKSATDYASTKHKGLPKKVTVKEISKWLKKLEEFRYRKVRGVDARRVASFVNRGMNEEDLPMSLRKKWEHRKYGREKHLANRYMTENGYDSVQKEGFGGELNDKDKQKFEKARKNNAEVLGYELSGTPDVKEDRDYKAEYKKYGSSTAAKKYRAELNQYNRKKGTYGNGDGKDASHKGGKIVGFENQSVNRGRAEKSRLRKEAVKVNIDKILKNPKIKQIFSRLGLKTTSKDDVIKVLNHFARNPSALAAIKGVVGETINEVNLRREQYKKDWFKVVKLMQKELKRIEGFAKKNFWGPVDSDVNGIIMPNTKKLRNISMDITRMKESVNEGQRAFLAYRTMKEGIEDIIKGIRILRGHIDNAPYNKKFSLMTSELYKFQIDMEKKLHKFIPQISKLSKDKMLESVNEAWSTGLERYKVTLENGEDIDVKVKEGKGLEGLEELLEKEGLKFEKITKKASRPTLTSESITESAVSFWQAMFRPGPIPKKYINQLIKKKGELPSKSHIKSIYKDNGNPNSRDLEKAWKGLVKDKYVRAASGLWRWNANFTAWESVNEAEKEKSKKDKEEMERKAKEQAKKDMEDEFDFDLDESVNERISVSDERYFGKKGIIIMIDDNGKKVSAIFKDKKNADKFNRNEPADIKKLLQLAKKTKYPKAIDESVNEDIGIDTYLGGIIKAMRNAGIKPKTAKQMKSGFSVSKNKVGFFIDVEQRGFDKIEKYTLQIEVDKKGDLWYLSGNRPVHMGPWADTNRITRMFRMLNKIRGFGQTKFGKV